MTMEERIEAGDGPETYDEEYVRLKVRPSSLPPSLHPPPSILSVCDAQKRDDE